MGKSKWIVQVKMQNEQKMDRIQFLHSDNMERWGIVNTTDDIKNASKYTYDQAQEISKCITNAIPTVIWITPGNIYEKPRAIINESNIMYGHEGYIATTQKTPDNNGKWHALVCFPMGDRYGIYNDMIIGEEVE